MAEENLNMVSWWNKHVAESASGYEDHNEKHHSISSV